MISRRAFSALSSAERHVLSQQYARQGQCVRYLHASIPKRADEAAAGTPKDEVVKETAAKPVSTRQQRSKKVSEEVSNLAKATPPAAEGAPKTTKRTTKKAEKEEKVSKAEPVTEAKKAPELKATDATKPAEPKETKVEAEPVAETKVPEPEVPTSKDATKPIETNDNAATAPVTPSLVPESPKESPKMESKAAAERNTSMKEKRMDTPKPKLLPLAGAPFNPESVSSRRYLRAGFNATTLAARNFQGVVEDYRSSATEKREMNMAGRNDVNILERKFLNGHLYNIRQRHGAIKKAHNKVVESYVLGKLDKRLGKDGPRYGQPAVDTVATLTLRNPTYMTTDVNKIMKKIQSLLPASATSTKEAALQRQQERRAKAQQTEKK